MWLAKCGKFKIKNVLIRFENSLITSGVNNI